MESKRSITGQASKAVGWRQRGGRILRMVNSKYMKMVLQDRGILKYSRILLLKKKVCCCSRNVFGGIIIIYKAKDEVYMTSDEQEGFRGQGLLFFFHTLSQNCGNMLPKHIEAD